MSVGVVIVTHYGLGQEFLQALRLIVPEAPEFHAVAIEPNQTVDAMRRAIDAALRAADQGQGVLVLTDMFGGTPANLGVTFLDDNRVEVITGVNLPMLIKLARPQASSDLLAVARAMREHGRHAIWVASDLLRSDRDPSREVTMP